MKLCFVCDEYPPGEHGGIGTMTQLLARALVRKGHEVRVIGTTPTKSDMPARVNDQGVEVLRIEEPLYRFGWISAKAQVYKKVSAWARNGHIDIVEAPDWKGPIAGWPQLPIPIIVRLHGSVSYFASEMNRPVPRTAYLLEKWALRRADYWCSVSRYTAKKTRDLFSLHSEPQAILYNPVDTPSRNGHCATGANVIFAGTLTEKKGVVPLIRAWKMVVREAPDAILHMFGKDGRAFNGQSMRAHLLSLLDSTERSRVVFHGHVARDRLFDALRNARLAIYPSFAEAFAIAPLEAMAIGCPTIYSQYGSGPELIEDGVDGLLVNPDEPKNIAGAILRLLGDDAMAHRLGHSAKQKIQTHFSVNSVVLRNIDFFRQCVQSFHRNNGKKA